MLPIRMKLLFISPHNLSINDERKYFPSIYHVLGKIFFAPPLNFRMLAAVTPPEYDIRWIDEEYQQINYDETCDIVGITVTTPLATRAHQIADTFRARGKVVVLGGLHSSALPEEAKQHADAVVVGEAERTWPCLLRDFQHGKLKSLYENEKPVDLYNIPLPDRKRMPHRQGFIIERMQATRGCTVGCKYCLISNSACGKEFRYKSIDNVVKELTSIRQKVIHFCDPSLTTNPRYTKQLFKAMKNLNKKLFCLGNVSILNHDEELLKLASEAGCINWGIGFESISQESLEFIGKKTNEVSEYGPVIKKIHDYGMGVIGSFMFGLDGDYPDIFDKTLDAIHHWDLDIAQFHIFTPFPGTPLFTFLEKEQRIITRDWSKYDVNHVVFQPKHMSPEQLLNGTKKAYEEFYSTYNVVKRASNCLISGLYPFLMMGLDNFFRKSDSRLFLKQ